MSQNRGSVKRYQANMMTSDNATYSYNKKTTERSPLIDSTGMTESFVNASVADMSQGVSWKVAAFLLVNTALGAGMLNYPYAYNQIGGVLSAALIQIVLLLFITCTMFILVYCADFNQDNTYHDVLLSMCGKRAQQISAMSILLTCYGINITFLIIIGDQYDRIFNSLLADYTNEFWFLDRKFTIFITAVLFIWPMCYAQRLDFLRYASILGMFAMLYVTFLTIYEHYQLDEATKAGITSQLDSATETTAYPPASQTASPNTSSQKLNQTLPSPAKHLTATWFEPLAIVPVLCFAYQTHEVIVPVYACMKQRNISQFMKASIFGLVILFFLYNLVGAYGYLTFGADVGPDIMSLYDAKDPVVIVGVVALVIKFITTYPPLMFCGRGALDGLYGEFRELSTSEFKSTEKTRRYIITTLWFFSTIAFAVLVPDISVTLQLLGSMASINVFVFPGMCLVSLTRRLRQARRALLLDETPDYLAENNQQRATDYQIISGSHFGAMKKNAAAAAAAMAAAKAENQHLTNGSALINSNGITTQDGQQFTATFASLIEFDRAAPTKFSGEHSGTANGNTGGVGGHGAGQSSQRFTSSIAPLTLAQIGISKGAACVLYLIAIFLIMFGSFIFVLELVNVLL